jgi:chloramphenicol-sensitive protein RarD
MGMASRRGFLSGLAAYVMWGFFPIYFHDLQPAGAVEILAHRIVWSAVSVAVLITVIRRWRTLRDLTRRPRTVAGIALAAVLIAFNWGTYIYGVNSDHVIETSLGYFINPLLSVLLGVFVFRERLSAAQWIAIGIGAAAVAVITVDYGHLPWIALVLAASFGSYGLVKKRLALPPAEGLQLEATMLLLPALGYLGWLTAAGRSTFTSISPAHTVLLMLSGIMTALPLVLFADAANRMPLTALGILQYTTPVLQLVVGLLIFHEPLPPAELAGFALVWLAIVIFTWDALRRAGRTRPQPLAHDGVTAAATLTLDEAAALEAAPYRP